jgi:hypothetical protein
MNVAFAVAPRFICPEVLDAWTNTILQAGMATTAMMGAFCGI